MYIDWTIPLFIGLVGGPLTLIFRFWYKKKENNPSKFADNGTYVRDDSLYSYDVSDHVLSEDKEKENKNK